MEYDADGIRCKKQVPSSNTTITYTYQGNNLIRETKTNDSSFAKTFLYNSQGIIGFVYQGVTYTYRKNLFGDIVAIYQGATKMAEYAYDAWGNCTIVSDTNYIGRNNPFRYRGYYWDNDLQLYYLMSRYYDPQTGRFINADSLEYLDPETIGGLNLYAYCGNNPVMGVDPMGTLAVATLIGIGALVGFLVSGITSLATELIDNKGDWSKINVGLVISDAIFGAIDGALSATGMGLGASIAVNMLLSGVQSVVTDLILGETDSMLENALLAMGTSIAYSFLPGGYDSKKLSGIYKTSDSYLGRLVSESKKLMYKNKKKLVLKTVAKQNLKYAGSTIVSSGIDWGLSKLEGIFA